MKKNKVVFDRPARQVVSVDTAGVLRWDGKQGAWCIGGIPVSDQRAAVRRHKLEKAPWWKREPEISTRAVGAVTGVSGRLIPKPKPGPDTTVEKGNPDRQKKPHTPVLKRYSMTPGVTYMKIAKRWVGFAKVDGKRTYLGTFDNEEMAAEAVNKAKI